MPMISDEHRLVQPGGFAGMGHTGAGVVQGPLTCTLQNVSKGTDTYHYPSLPITWSRLGLI